MSRNQTKPCCAKCQHFHRDFNRYRTARQLKDIETGYCMAQPPKPYYEDVDEVIPRTKIAMFPMVDEDAVCGAFKPRQ